jgi:hypothetical protein
MEPNVKSTSVENLWRLLKNNKWIASAIIIGSVVIAVAKFTDAVQTILEFIRQQPAHNKKVAIETHKEIDTLFKKVNDEYKKHFQYYLNYIDKGEDPHKIIRQLTDLNKLTAIDRANLVRLVRNYGNNKNTKVMMLLNSDNIYKLLMDYFGFSDTDYMYSEFEKENIFYQRWRTSIKDDIEAILSENWQKYFDPGASKPPMSQDEIKSEIMNTWKSIKGPNDIDFDMKKFQNYLIRRSIDESLTESQILAIKIQKKIDELKPN